MQYIYMSVVCNLTKTKMYDNIEDDPNNLRELNKIGLETYFLDLNNVLDRQLDEVIKTSKKRMQDEYDKHNKLHELSESESEQFNELEEKAQKSGHSLQIQMYDHIRTANYLEDELFAFFEVKIIYAFKHLEIEIKKLLRTAYSDKSISHSYKWENIIQFIKSKDIKVKELENYDEINQLRNVNNFLKHSSEYTPTNLEGIPEFRGNDRITFELLENFYNRIKSCTLSFLQSLSNAIYVDLYEFDDEKIDNLTKSIVLRMNKEQADKFIEQLKSKY